MNMPIRRLLCCAWLALTLASGASAQAEGRSLRIASAFDPQTMDPHALALLYHSRVAFQVYDSLLGRDHDFRLEPALALQWRLVNPTTWRFVLRPGVLFHDGSTFSADDAVFSIERALAAPSQRAFQLKGATGAKKIDSLSFDIELSAPDAVLPEKLVGLPMMSKAWSLKHGVEKSQDFNGKQETHAVRHANGTGPFMLER
jgi:peptide/nickel transport system substrate-binding protein